MKDTKKAEPMDPSFREDSTGAPSTNTQRVCYAIKTLTEEVWALFPETPVEYSDHDGRNTALAVTFDLTGLADHDRADLLALLTLFDFDSEPRINEVIADDDGGAVLVSMHRNPRTQDSRETFGLAEALYVLVEPEGEPA